MSRTPDLLAKVRRRLRNAGDGGFTLGEVMVSLTVFAVVSSAAGAMIITGLRTSMVSKMDTGAKNLAQERVEIMRNLPFHIDRDPAATTADYSDLLDTYYRNLTAAATTTSTGYVNACGAQTAVCSTRPAWDPRSGSFYRYVIDPIPGYPQYKQYVTTQFINADRVPLSPGTYDSQVSGIDAGPSSFVSVMVTTFWAAGTLNKSFQVETLISAGRPAASRITLQARAAALSFSGGLDPSRLLTMQNGVVNLDGALAVGASSAAQASGSIAEISNGASIEGAEVGVQAPPNADPASGDDTAKDLFDNTVSVAHFGVTESTGVGAKVTGGLPSVGTAANPVVAEVSPHGAGTTPIWFSNSPAPSVDLMLDLTQPRMWVEQTIGSVPAARATGYLEATTGASHAVTANASANALTLKMFKTSFAPDGVLQVTLTSSSLTCTTTGTVGSGTLEYSGSVSYWTPEGYVTMAVDHTQAASPLAAVPLATTQVGTNLTGGAIYLGDYVASWESVNADGAAGGTTVDADNNRVESTFDGLVKVTSTELRPADATSSAGVRLGSLSCIAEDNR